LFDKIFEVIIEASGNAHDGYRMLHDSEFSNKIVFRLQNAYRLSEKANVKKYTLPYFLIHKKSTIRTGLCILVFSCFLMPRPVDAQNRCALVLSGGGSRGFAQIGVLKALETLNIKPDLIVATSMGAIIGALYASGFSADSIAALIRSVDWSSIYRNTSPRKSLFVIQKEDPFDALFELRFNYNLKPILPNAISHGQAFYDLLTPLLIVPQFKAGMVFDSLKIPLRILATDLMTGNRIVIKDGNIATAIRASCAVPLAFSPVEIDDKLLSDGGIAANIPVETAYLEGAILVLLVDVTSPLWKKEDLDNPVRLVDQIVSISRIVHRDKERLSADIVIRPDLEEYKNNDFEKIDTMISAGFQKTLSLKNEIIALLNRQPDRKQKTGFPSPEKTPAEEAVDVVPDSAVRHSQTPTPAPPLARHRTMPVTEKILLSGNDRTRGHLLLNASGLNPGDTLNGATTKRVITSLYATDLFENVNVDIDSQGVVRIMVEEKKYLRMRIGLRFDDFHLGEGFVEPAYENCFGIGMIALMHLQYGLRREKYTVELLGNHQFSRNFTINFQSQLYTSKEKIREIDTAYEDSSTMISTIELHENTLRKTGFNIFIGTQVGRFSLLSGGIRLERFLVQTTDADMLGDLFGLHFKKTLPSILLKLSMDSMDRFPFPTSGTKMFLSLSGTGKILGGRYAFLKYSGSLGRYLTFFKIHTIFPMISFSWSNDALPEVERSYLGGTLCEERYRELSVHNYIPFIGLPPRTLLGDCFGIAHFEYRCEIKKNLFTHFLVDWGSAWDSENGNFQDIISEAPVGVGIGISYLTFFGPVRLTYGQLMKNESNFHNKQTESVYFSAGYDF
jgi:NTE family protein